MEYVKRIRSIATRALTSWFKLNKLHCEACHRTLTLQHVSAHKVGIMMHDRWYCSSFCFASAAEEELSELVISGLDRPSRVERMPLGLMLISRGLLTSAELREVRETQKEEGGEIGEILVQRGTVSEKELTSARATQWGCPVYEIPKHVTQPNVYIPSTLMQFYSVIPLHYVAAKNLLFVGFVHGVEYGLLYAIEKMTGCKTQPCFVTPSDFQSQMQQRKQVQTQGDDTVLNEVKFEDVHSSAEIASILCSYGAHLEADEATIEKCKEYLWARLKCGPKEVDLLFKAG
jgi:hypothetical protein